MSSENADADDAARAAAEAARAAAEATERSTSAADYGRRAAIIGKLPEYHERTFLGVRYFRRLLTPDERARRLAVAAAEATFVQTGDMTALVELTKDETRPRNDPLDRVRVAATLVMVVGLFAIVYFVATKDKPPTNATSLVSLASGLAGIGLGWLFGHGAGSAKKK